MKFTDGYWRLKEGIQAFYPAQVYDYEIKDKSIIIYAPFTVIHNKGETLQGPLFEIHFSSPFPEVIQVKVYHFKGGVKKGPDFSLFSDDNYSPEIRDEEDYLILKAGKLKVKINKKGAFSFTFYDENKALTSSGFKHLAYIIDEKKNTYMREQLLLSVGELVYGLGERFTPLIKNGQSVEIWNADGGTTSQLAYKNIPFYITNRGYGVLVNHPELVSFEIASESVERAQFSVAGEYLNYLVINGPTLKKTLENYTQLTGKPSLPPV